MEAGRSCSIPTPMITITLWNTPVSLRILSDQINVSELLSAPPGTSVSRVMSSFVSGRPTNFLF